MGQLPEPPQLLNDFRSVAETAIEPPGGWRPGEKAISDLRQKDVIAFITKQNELEIYYMRLQTASLRAMTARLRVKAAALNLEAAKSRQSTRRPRTGGKRPLRRLTKEKRELWRRGC
jgi:hypothetical protein